MLVSVALMAELLAGTALPAKLPGRVQAFIKSELKLEYYDAMSFDLNGDSSPEIILYANGPEHCGSGGCTLYVLTPQATSYRVITTITIVQLPIRVLSTTSHGWHDLGVHVSGGGISRPYEARMRFDGQTYHRNPTIAPAAPARKATGRVVLE
jgi:hypothetical protein